MTINKLGLCSSYTEASICRRNAALTQGDDMTGAITDNFVQFQADNVDHATKTLDGHGPIHVMGQMTPTFATAIKVTRTVPRVKVNIHDIMSIGNVKMIPQANPKPVQGNIIHTSTKLDEFSRDNRNDKFDIM